MTMNMPTPKPKSKATPWLIAGALVVFGVFCIGATITVADSYSDAPTMSGGKPIGITSGGAAKSAEQKTYVPKPADFQLGVKVLKKTCFGSAGCNIEYRVELTYLGTTSLDSGIAYDVTYEVKGGDDPQISTLTVQGAEFEQDSFQYIQTPSSKSVLTAVVTSVTPA